MDEIKVREADERPESQFHTVQKDVLPFVDRVVPSKGSAYAERIQIFSFGQNDQPCLAIAIVEPRQDGLYFLVNTGKGLSEEEFDALVAEATNQNDGEPLSDDEINNLKGRARKTSMYKLDLNAIVKKLASLDTKTDWPGKEDPQMFVTAEVGYGSSVITNAAAGDFNQAMSAMTAGALKYKSQEN